MTVSILCEMLLLGMMLASTAHAQIIGPGPKQGKVQIGGWWAFLHYDQLYRYDYTGAKWRLKRDIPRDRAALMLRYGITDRHYVLMNFGFLKKQNESDDGVKYSSYEGVWGIGGAATLCALNSTWLRIGGEYNDVVWYQEDIDTRPWRGRDARVALTVERTLDHGDVSLTPACGVLVFSAREKEYDGPYLIREKNRHYVGPVIASIVSFYDRVNLGLELTFGAITDFRWRAEIQL